jgi:hypothetical protein
VRTGRRYDVVKAGKRFKLFRYTRREHDVEAKHCIGLYDTWDAAVKASLQEIDFDKEDVERSRFK